MTDYATQFADLLERIAVRVRALSVDRAHRAITIVSLALPTLVLALLGLAFLYLTILSALEIALGTAGAYGLLAGLFLVGGLLAWRSRTKDFT